MGDMRVLNKAPEGRNVLSIKISWLFPLLLYCFVLAGSLLFFQYSAWAKDVTLAWDANNEANLPGVTNTDSPLDGAAIIHDGFLPGNTGIVPYVGPTDDNVL